MPTTENKALAKAGEKNSLQRLADAGEKNSVSTETLFNAANDLAVKIAGYLPAYVRLPRGYQLVIAGTERDGYDRHLAKYNTHHDIGNSIFGNPINLCDGFSYFAHADRKDAIQLAQDIASGWLEEVALFLETRAGQANEATDILRRASADVTAQKSVQTLA